MELDWQHIGCRKHIECGDECDAVAGGIGFNYFNGVVTNAGTVTMPASRTPIRTNFYNLSGALFNVQLDYGINGGGVFNNAGVFRKSVTTGTSGISVPFNNSGTLDVASGTVELAGGGTLGGMARGGRGELNFAAGGFGGAGFNVSETEADNLTSWAEVSFYPGNPLPSLALTNGTLTLNGTVTNLHLDGSGSIGRRDDDGAGIMEWTNGVLGDSNTTLTVASNAILLLAGVNGTDYTWRISDQCGTIDMQSGNLTP